MCEIIPGVTPNLAAKLFRDSPVVRAARMASTSSRVSFLPLVRCRIRSSALPDRVFHSRFSGRLSPGSPFLCAASVRLAGAPRMRQHSEAPTQRPDAVVDPAHVRGFRSGTSAPQAHVRTRCRAEVRGKPEPATAGLNDEVAASLRV